MSEDILKGNWKQLRGEIQHQWGKLTDDEMDQIEGNRMKLVGKLQEEYGYTKQEAEREVDRFMKKH